jgi:hypothetical protein
MKSDRKRLTMKLDRVFGDHIKESKGRVCVLCGKKRHIQAGHLFSRVSHSTRWDEINVWPQCRGCNYKHEFRPEHFHSWFIHSFGLEAWDTLRLRANTPRKFTLDELRDLIEHYGKLT